LIYSLRFIKSQSVLVSKSSELERWASWGSDSYATILTSIYNNFYLNPKPCNLLTSCKAIIIIDYRCYSASLEAIYPSQLKQRNYNFDLLKACNKDVQELTNLINASIPIEAHIIRIHVGGDFYSQNYFDAWLNVAMLNRENHRQFYAYTKSLPFWINRLDSIKLGEYQNMELIASRGGTKDKLINVYGLREAIVVDTEQEAIDKGLEIDYTDYLACYGKESFALLNHGTQPKRINQRIKNKKLLTLK